MISVLLLEDEYYTRTYFKKLLSENPFVGAIYDTSSGREAVSYAQKHKPDVALLDIELGGAEGLTGIDAAKTISGLQSGAIIVFITGYSQYALESFIVHPYDYLLKPVKEKRFQELINALAEELGRKANPNKSVLPIREKDVEDSVVTMLPLADLLFVEKVDRFSNIHTRKRVFVVDKTIAELHEKLGAGFLKVHRSFVVNPDNIGGIREVSNRSYEIFFTGYEHVALMSRNGFKEHKDRLIPQ